MAPFPHESYAATEPPVILDDNNNIHDDVIADHVIQVTKPAMEKSLPVIVGFHHQDTAISSRDEQQPHDNNDSGHDDDFGLMKTKQPSSMRQFMMQPCSRSFAMRLTSNILFVLASCLYVTLAVTDMQYYTAIQGISDDVLLADDDATWTAAGFVDDDYFFSVGGNRGSTSESATTVVGDDDAAAAVATSDAGVVWVSEYQMIYFSAALLFCMVGLLDFIQQPGWLSIGMIAAGCFGLISAMLVHKNVHVSNIFNTISVHLFMVEASALFFHHGRIAHVKTTGANNSTNHAMMEPLQYLIRIGDVSWIGGTVLDVVLSYFAIRNTYVLPHAKVSVFSSLLWLACSLIYVTATCIAEYLVRKQCRLEEQFEKSYSPRPQTQTSSSEGDDSA
jgi:hypothetical protein